MRNFIQRLLTGIIYVGLIVGGALMCPYLFWACMVLALGTATKEYFSLISSLDNTQPQKGMGIVLVLALFALSFSVHLFKTADIKLLLVFLPLLFLPLTLELFRKQEAPFKNIAYTLLAVCYLGIPFSCLIPIAYWDGSFSAPYILLLFCCLWVYDSGAYVVGISIGKHRLFERISPKKSWEGAIGGLSFALLACYLFFHFQYNFSTQHSLWFWLGAGITICVSGTLGDLVESMFKRSIGVKDSGKVLPGHGGLLDRFDSLIFAAPALLSYFYLYHWF